MARDEAYREAERKIEQARRSQATELDLSNMRLTDFPDDYPFSAHVDELLTQKFWLMR